MDSDLYFWISEDESVACQDVERDSNVHCYLKLNWRKYLIIHDNPELRISSSCGGVVVVVDFSHLIRSKYGVRIRERGPQGLGE